MSEPGTVREEVRSGARAVVAAAVAAGVRAFVGWVRTRPIKRWRAKRKGRA